MAYEGIDSSSAAREYNLELFMPRPSREVRTGSGRTNAKAGGSVHTGSAGRSMHTGSAGRGNTGRADVRTDGSGALKLHPQVRRRHRAEDAAANADNAAALRYDRTKLVYVVAFITVTVAVFAMLIVSDVQSHELSNEVDKRSDTLDELILDYDAMMDDLTSQISDYSVEKYAEEYLGMHKRTYNQTEYISIGTGNVFEVTYKDSKDKPWLPSTLS